MDFEFSAGWTLKFGIIVDSALRQLNFSLDSTLIARDVRAPLPRELTSPEVSEPPERAAHARESPPCEQESETLHVSPDSQPHPFARP